jgi:hypothetical protein
MTPAQQRSRTRKIRRRIDQQRRTAWPKSPLWVIAALMLALAIAGCGAPGEPVPPTPPIPATISDLSARQVGDAVELSFSLPSKTVDGDPLKEPPAVEILQTGTQPDGSPDLKHLQVVSTTPGALVPKLIENGLARITSPVSPEGIKTHPGEKLSYVVRTRASKRRASANSNAVTIVVFPTAEPVTGLEAKVTETAIELRWRVSEKTTTGDPLQQSPKYSVYRGEVASTSSATGGGQEENKWVSPPALLGTTDTAEYRDTSFAFGKTYVYMVRSALTWGAQTVESVDSEPVRVVAKDTFPPHAPQNVVATVVPKASGVPEVELSWAINTETDLAGYHVYRSEQEGTRGESITPDLLLTPALRDTTVKPGHRYWYTVTAVDTAGNESEPSVSTSVDVAQPSP